MDKEARITEQFEESIHVKGYLQAQAKGLITIAGHLTQAFPKGKKVLLSGNGGRAADAQHIAGELAGKFYIDRDSLPATALNTNTSSLTAIADDYGYELVFAGHVRGLASKGDVVIGISTSGESINVFRATEEAESFR